MLATTSTSSKINKGGGDCIVDRNEQVHFLFSKFLFHYQYYYQL